MAVWYENQDYGVFEGQMINRYQLIVLHKQGVSYIIVYGE